MNLRTVELILLIMAVTDCQPSEPTTNLWFDISTDQWPIVYTDDYNVRFEGLEKYFSFNSEKWGDIFQGNGYEKDFKGKEDKVYIMDVYNGSIYPKDRKAEAAIRCKVKLKPYTKDSEYLSLVRSNLRRSLDSFHPDILVYNAGTDILETDDTGSLSISPLGIIERDEIVFREARERKIPIVMLTSGGFTKESSAIVADSIINLHKQGIIQKME